MGKEQDLKTTLFQSMILYARENYKDTIDKAYEYFWEDNYPEDFLRGIALDIAFVNFEDWLIFDYKVNNDKETFIDIYSKYNKELKDDESALLNKIKETVLSLYEVISVSREEEIHLKDLLLEGDFIVSNKNLAGGIKTGDIFATRLLTLDGKTVMSNCVYPYTAGYKKTILEYIDKEFYRYTKNENPESTMKSFLNYYGDVFNILWIDNIRIPPQKKEES